MRKQEFRFQTNLPTPARRGSRSRPPLRRPRPLRFERLRVPVWNPYSRGRLGPAKSEDRKGGERKNRRNLTIFLASAAPAHLSPVLELIRRTSPLLASAPFYNAVALSELALGLMLLAGVWRRWTAASAVLHLMGTFSVVFSSPQTAFRPSFPILT